jgi:hypothetical protein
VSEQPRGIDAAYRHGSKRAAPGAPLELGDTHLKWYELALPETPVDPAMSEQARRFLMREAGSPALRLNGDCGFVILHRCGRDFHFFLVSTWRGSNELWEAVYFCDAGSPEFAQFEPAYPQPESLRPTFCVWELGIVAHEARAWSRLLASLRGAVDLAAWRDDLFAGDV